MQQCPKCGSSVPDGRTTCQICSAELDPQEAKVAGPIGLQAPLAPRAVAEDDDPANRPGIPGIDRPQEGQDVLSKQIGGGAQAAATGGVELRRTLAGDVIEVPVAGPVRAGGPMLGQSPSQGQPMRPIPRQPAPGGPTIPPLRTGAGPTRGVSAEGTGSGSKAGIILLILVLLLGGGGAGGYWYWQQTRPAAAATLFFEAVQAKNWSSVYDQIELPAQAKGIVTRDAFVKLMGLVGSQIKIDSFKVVSSTINGDTATVKMSVTGTLGKKSATTDTTDLNLRKVDGVWKIDATGAARGLPGLMPGK
jgi:hypothetical protein